MRNQDGASKEYLCRVDDCIANPSGDVVGPRKLQATGLRYFVRRTYVRGEEGGKESKS